MQAMWECIYSQMLIECTAQQEPPLELIEQQADRDAGAGAGEH